MRIAIIAFTANGCKTALRIRDSLDGEDVTAQCKTTHDVEGIEMIQCSSDEWTAKTFPSVDAIVFVGATGIAVRLIAPYVKTKDVDPAVVCVDEHGRYAIALLSGHIGGSNRLTARIAAGIGATPIITTATDINGKFSVDVFATENCLRITDLHKVQIISADILADKFVGISSDRPIEGNLPHGLTEADAGHCGVRISSDPSESPFNVTLNLVPMDISVGVGCKRGILPGKMLEFVLSVLKEEGIAPERVGSVSSIDLKSDERAVLDLAASLKCPVMFFTAEELMSLEGKFSGSNFVRSVTAVDCVCERAAIKARGGTLIRRKTASDGMTVALSKIEVKPRF